MPIFDAGGRIPVGHRLGHDFPGTSRMARRAHPTGIVPNRIASLLFRIKVGDLASLEPERRGLDLSSRRFRREDAAQIRVAQQFTATERILNPP
jgi:hypothetical protein